MKPLPHETELQKVLDAIKEVAPHFKIPPLYMFTFMERNDVRGTACLTEEICLSMRTIGEFSCSNYQFIKTVVHEVVHINYWEEGHNSNFHAANNLLFRKVLEKLNKEKGEQNGKHE